MTLGHENLMSTVFQSAMSPGYCVKEDSVVYGFEEIDFDTDFDIEETKSQHQADAPEAYS
ncbi:MAG: hypothetical protein HF981_10920 [Desulfobacteraceae bacterium]|nr:hypothetical protein [Desulfobacteraceae bacterium]MBC2750886.1 hypothetical protein [Desulfobacteraceae bacterium]